MAQYTAPGRDGTYIDDPGRDKPAYDEKESLLMVNELDKEEDEDNPFRPPPEEDEQQHQYQDDPSESNEYHSSTDDGKFPRPEQPLDGKKKDGDKPDDDSDDDSDDLFFEEDKEAIKKGHQPADGATNDVEDPTEFKDEDEPEQVEEEDGRRQWKYSTANIKQRGIWVKWCCIALFFLLCLIIFAAISTLFQKLFFDDKGPDPEYPKRPDNDTFPNNKELIDSVCSSATMSADRGVRCREYCEPMHSSCCDLFNENETYNFTSVNDALNATLAPTFMYNVSDYSYNMSDDDLLELKKCEFGEHLRGCSAYSKCSALKELLDPAPATLPQLCSAEGIARDAQSCPAACRKADCCFNEEGVSCLNENFDACMDYAPCQNLRKPALPSRHIVPVAPDDIDRVCLWKLPDCYEYCEKARCCTDPNSRCLQENFISCLTYAACEDATDVIITIPPIYSVVPQAPAELFYACGERDADNERLYQLIQPESCPEYCEQVACCYQNTPNENCFHRDPLGCLAWHHYCQTEAAAVTNWYIGEFILPTPP